jgi:hypothetical protein
VTSTALALPFLAQLMAYLWLESQDYEAKKAGPEQERLVSYLT